MNVPFNDQPLIPHKPKPAPEPEPPSKPPRVKSAAEVLISQVFALVLVGFGIIALGYGCSYNHDPRCGAYMSCD